MKEKCALVPVDNELLKVSRLSRILKKGNNYLTWSVQNINFDA